SSPCLETEFECQSGRCLPGSWRCNGQTECLGEGPGAGSDEQGCQGNWDEHGQVAGPGPEAQGGRGQASPGPCGGLLTGFYGWFSPPALAGPPLTCITCVSNYKVVEVESRTGLLSLTYHMMPGSGGQGFNATYRIAGYCLLWSQEEVCGGSLGGCYTKKQRCDGHWDCPETGRDEQGCWGCPRGEFACGGAAVRGAVGKAVGHPVCFPPKERCNYQLYCADGSDERACSACQPGTFHCDTDRCVFESWRCDGQVDCKDGTDELNCTVTLPRKVITAATLGS
ncbi:hypothetical protein JZ751_015414, partial [Albula glossodonta]